MRPEPRHEISSRDSASFSVNLLIRLRALHDDLALAVLPNEIAAPVELHFACAFETETNLFETRVRCDNEVVLELSLVSVIDQIDAFIYLLVAHTFVSRDIRAPFICLIAD